MAKRKKSYNLILYELQQEAVRQEALTGRKVASDVALQKQAEEEYIAPIKNVNPANRTNPNVKMTSQDTSKMKTATNKTSVEKKWYEQILQKPKAFDDGYQFGDITKTIGGSVLDLGTGVAKGAIGIGEGVGSLLTAGVAQVADWAGQDEWADEKREKLANFSTDPNKLTNKISKWQEKNVDDYSIFGGTSDKTSEALGYIGGIWATGGLASGGAAAAGASAGTAATIGNVAQTAAMFGSAAGGVVPEVYKEENVEDWQAWTKILGTGAIETATERLFGIFGKSGLDTGLANAISSKITSGAGKILARVGVQASSEAAEEFLAYSGGQGLDIAIDFINQQTGGDGADFKKDWNWEEVGEQMAIAFLASGALGSGVNVTSTIQNKNKTNTWGEALNETARKQDEQAQIEGLQQSILEKQQELNKSKDAREKQIIQETLNGLNQELSELTNVQIITDESELRKQNFTYEANENDSDIRKAVYESASQVMNNTEKSHKFVDVVAKIAEEKGTAYKFTNNEQLKQLGYTKEGMTVNGLVNKNGEVLINIDSAKALNTVVGHETTHLLEGTKEYEALKQIAIEYSKTKGDYDARIEKLTKLYEGTNADIEAELTSDIVGEYLFTDENFVRELSVKQPTVFEKIKNFISDLIVKFKGTDQEKQLRQLQRSFEKAYKAQGKQTTDTKYSVSDNKIQGLEDYTKPEIKNMAAGYIQTALEYADINAEIVGMEIIGSRNRGNARPDSDLDIVVELNGEDLREDDLFNILNDIDEPLEIDGIRVDINPIVAERTGTLEEFMERSNAYDKEILSKQSTTDNQGRKLTKEQQEYFKDSKVRDENGNLLTMYHGTKDDFTIFKNVEGKYDTGFAGKGFYFTSGYETAESYSNWKKGNNDFTPKVMSVYLNIKNPLVINDLSSGIKVAISEALNVDINTNNVMKITQEESGKITKELIKQGYDGVLYEFDGDTLAMVVDSNQIKNVDNTNPTTDPDIRYSLSEEGKMVDNKGNEVKLEAAEAGTHGTLMAIHNFNSSVTKGVLELGGFPAPSIAITNPKIVNHEQFGDVSVLFDKSTIDPANRQNEVYDRDVWSQDFPKVEYDINNADIKKYISKNLEYDYKDDIISRAVNSYMYDSNLSDKIDRSGLEQTLKDIKDDNHMKYLYKTSVEKDSNYSPEMKEKKFSNYYDNKTLKRFIDSFNKTHDMSLPDFFYHYINYKDMALSEGERTQLNNQIIDAIKPEIEGYWNEFKDRLTEEQYKKAVQEEIDGAIDSYGKWYDFLMNAQSYDKNGEHQVIDTEATLKNIDKHIDKQAYEEWVDSTFGEMFKNVEKGIRNNKDPYTASGNRRSFKQLHDSYNLENIVKAMTAGETKGGEGGMFSGGFGTIQAKMARRFNSIENIKAYEDRITTAEQAKAITEPLRESIRTDIEELAEYYNSKSSYFNNSFENASEAIAEFAGKSKKDIATFKKVLNGFYNFEVENIPDSLYKKIINDLNNLKDIPTDYFEAKPQRAIRLDEAEAFVVPNDMSDELKQQLRDRGINVIEYDPNIEGDRQAKINEFDNLKFSLSSENEIAPTGNWNVRGEDIKLQVEETIAPIQETMEQLDNKLDVLQKQLTEMQDNLAPTEQDIQEATKELSDKDLPPIPEDTTPEFEDAEPGKVKSPLESRDIDEVGNRSIKAYQYENPEVKPYFQEEAQNMLYDLDNTIKGERGAAIDELGNMEYYGITRQTTEAIAYLKDNYGYSYDQIRQGLNKIIEDDGKENNAVSKRIEFMLDERLREGYTTSDGIPIPANEDYIKFLNEKQITEYNKEAFNAITDEDVPMENVQSLPPELAKTKKELEKGLKKLYKQYKTATDWTKLDDIEAKIRKVENALDNIEKGQATIAVEPKTKTIQQTIPMKVKTAQNGNTDVSEAKQRKWVETSTESEVVNREILPDDLDQSKIFYQPITNKATLGKANVRLDTLGYEKAVDYFNNQILNKTVTVEDIALGERLIQEAIKNKDTKTAGELIQDIAILGTELGQKVQALSIIQRMTPEGQLKMLEKTINRGKVKGDKAFTDVNLTQEMKDKILNTYNKDGSYNQEELNKAVDEVKQEIADQMPSTMMDKVNAWRYLSMLGNPKTHIRNLVSNVAMKGTVAVKNALARTIETIAPIENRTRTWKTASEDVTNYAKQTAIEMKNVISGDSKYSETADIKAKRETFKNKILEKISNLNSDLLEKEDWWFSKGAFENSFREFLTANGMETKQDIENNPELIEKGKQYAVEQAQIATFRQYSWLSNKIRDIENKNTATQIAVGAVLPFKKTPINIAKTGLSYSPLGFAKTLTYDIAQVKKGNMEASTLIDHIAQNTTGTALTLVGYMLAQAGFLNGAGDDDKEGKYDYQLGKQAYSLNIGGNTYSLSWLSPVAMPLFVGTNAYEQLVEGEEWNADVVLETLGQTLDPLSEMSFLSSLDSVLSSYDSGVQRFFGIGEAMAQNYVTQFAPTLMSQIAATKDDTKRSTKVSGDSTMKVIEETYNKLIYKIPGLRETLEPSTDIWGNEIKQSENLLQRAFENFISPYSRKESIATQIDEELKDLYGQTGDTGLLPSIPYNYVKYDGEKYNMSAEEYTDYKKMYGQTANDLLEDLFRTTTYKNATSEERADMVNDVYDYARDEAKLDYLAKEGVDYTNATEDKVEVYEENLIKGAIENDMTTKEYGLYVDDPEEYKFLMEKDYEYRRKYFDTYDSLKELDESFEEQKEGINDDDELDTLYSDKKAGIVDKIINSGLDDTEKASLYKRYYNSDTVDTIMKSAINIDDYLVYETKEFKADKNAKGNSIPGSRKDKVIDYVNTLDMEIGQKAILIKSTNTFKFNDYNTTIVEYVDGLNIAYEDKVEILRDLDFEVLEDGTVKW